MQTDCRQSGCANNDVSFSWIVVHHEGTGPIQDIADSELVLGGGQWHIFHYVEAHHLNVWRGDTRPEEEFRLGQ